MSKLPDPQGFTGHRATLGIPQRANSSKPAYDLQELDKRFMTARERTERKLLDRLGNDLISRDFWKSCEHRDAGVRYFGYSEKDESLTIHLTDDDQTIQTIAIRTSTNSEGELVKWKTYGRKTFIPYRIEDDFVFLFSGMAEIIIMELLGLSFIGLQSDSMVRHLPEGLRSKAEGKTVIVLQDNDESFKRIVPDIKSFFARSEVLIIDFEQVLDRQLKHGYDFRDYCNEVRDATKVLQTLETEIIVLQDKSYVRAG